jgi:hypothetical protein
MRRHAAAAALALWLLAAPAPAGAAVWISQEELRRLPTSGPGWEALVEEAEEDPGEADLSDQDSDHDVRVLAAALVAARMGDEGLRRRAADGVLAAVGTEDGGRTLALGRGLIAYVVAADLVGLRRLDPPGDRRFRAWLADVRRETLEPDENPTLVLTHELRPNNWGTHAGASRIAASTYLGDRRDVARAAAVFKGWLGDRRIYAGFRYRSLSWQADPTAPVGVNPPGARRDGHPVDGAQPDDMRRGCDLQFPPCPTLYPWEAMQGAVAQAELLWRRGYDAYDWGGQALRRAAAFLFALSDRYGAEEWGAPRGHAWVPWLLNARYGEDFPTHHPESPGKGMGYADWTAGALGCVAGRCRDPERRFRVVRPAAPPDAPDVRSPAETAALVALAAAAVLAVASAAAVGLRRRRSLR